LLVKVSTSFCEQKEAKKLFYAGASVCATASPNGTILDHKTFFGPFFQKRTASLIW
jgi:hypothetical protein